jgi:ankyrin repeat protein
MKHAIAKGDLSKVKQLIESNKISPRITWKEVSLYNGRGTMYHSANLLSLSKNPEITEYLIKQGTPVSDYDLLNMDLDEKIEVEKRVLTLLKEEKRRLDFIELKNHFTEYESFQRVPNLTQLRFLVEKGVRFKARKNPTREFLFSKFNSLSRSELIDGAELIARNGGSLNGALEIIFPKGKSPLLEMNKGDHYDDMYEIKNHIRDKIYKENFQLVKKILELGANPEEAIYLHFSGPEESRLLLQFGADVNKRNESGETVLCTILDKLRFTSASENNLFQRLEILLEYKAQTTNIDSTENSISHKVIRLLGQTEKFEKTLKLFKKHKIKVDFQALNKYNQSSFFELIDDFDAKYEHNPFKKTDANISTQLYGYQEEEKKNDEIHKNVLSLLEAYPKGKLNSPDIFGNTISHVLAVVETSNSKDYIERIKLFKSRGGDLSFANKNGNSFLHFIDPGRLNEEDFWTLLELLKPNYFTTPNNEGITPLESLIFSNRIDLKQLMILKTGLDIDIKNKFQQTIMFSEKIMTEYSFNNKGCVLNFISQQNINQKDNAGNTALHHAVIRGFRLSENTINEFMKHGFDANTKNNKGDTVQELMKYKDTREKYLEGSYNGDEYLKLIDFMNPLNDSQ